MTRRIIALLLLVAILCLPAVSLAEKARFLLKDGNSRYHAQHLQEHTGSENCRISGNYITVRSGKGSGSTLGHVEQADSFRLEEISGTYARITVTWSAPTSPRSHAGLSGWINADYVECPCSRGEYYNGPARRTHDLARVNGGGRVTLKETASASARGLCSISAGETVEVLGTYDSWVRVRWGQRTGFLKSSQLTVTASGIPEEGSSRPVQPLQPGKNDGWRAAYQALLMGNHSHLGPAALYDMDRDGIPELIVHNGDDSMAGAACLVYTWSGDSAVYIGTVGFRDCQLTCYPGSAYPGLFCKDGNMGVYTCRCYSKQGLSIREEDVLEEDHTWGGAVSWSDVPLTSQLTGDAALFRLVQGKSASALTMYSYQEIERMGWSAFLQ